MKVKGISMNGFFISFSLALCLIVLSTPTQSGASQVGTPAPAFELVTFGGQSYSNESLKGRPVLLVFWAPWCNVCERELPLLSAFYQLDRPAQLDIVSVGFADSRSNVERFVKERAGTFIFPTAYDDDRWTTQAFKVNATPTYVVLDPQGSIVLVHRGAGMFQNGQFREFLTKLKN
jgi:thiol-disulfide isomerase/thioredoxin